MWHSLLNGVSAAVLTPRTDTDSVAENQFRHNLYFLLARGIRSFALNGATGEFCLTSPAQLERILANASPITDFDGQFVVGIGTPGYTTSVELGRMAADAGAKAVLLPMPYFFPYEQADLRAFVTRVADALSIPVLLYNLPQFTSAIAPQTSLQLIREHENIAGIKDSSGSLETLRLLTAEGVDCCRIVGSDGALGGALKEGVCDGVVSGVACVLPELIQRVFAAGISAPGSVEFRAANDHLEALIEEINVLPVPWGLKVVSEERQLGPAKFALPIAPERQLQIAQLRTWFRQRSQILSTATF
jgi:dihydrodipicolinate synthase/N-acetylneuraminate lyase